MRDATEHEADDAVKELRRMIEAAEASNQAGENAVVHTVAASRLPPRLVAALLDFDQAQRAHLRDCWLHEEDDVTKIDARYHAYKDAEDRALTAIRSWAARHCHEFSRMVDRRERKVAVQ